MLLNIVSTSTVYIAYAVHLCNNILMLQGKPESGLASHPFLGTSLVQTMAINVASSTFIADLREHATEVANLARSATEDRQTDDS